MGLVARRDFIGDEGRQYKAGDPCDEALNWRYSALRGCLSMGFIEDTSGAVDEHFGRLSDATLAVQRAERRASKRAMARAAAALAAARAPEVEPAASTPAATGETPCHEPAADMSAAGVPEVVAPGQVACTDCDKLFASEHAMRIHYGKAHRG